jgi:hypothetical protein
MHTRTDRRTGRQADRQTYGQAGRQTDRQADRQTDRQNFCLVYGNKIVKCNYCLKSGLQSLVTLTHKSDQFDTFVNITKMLIEIDKTWEKFVCVKENSRKSVSFLCTGI